MTGTRDVPATAINPRTGKPWTWHWLYAGKAGRTPQPKLQQGVLRLDPALKPPRKLIRR